MSQLLLYTSDDGQTRLDLRVEGQTIWLTQLEIAELFQTTKQNVSLHAKNIFEEGELNSEATVKESLTVRTEGKREVQRPIQLHNLDLILAIGFRVRSPRGVQFRQWASSHLTEFLVKGFVMDDERLKNPGGWDYWRSSVDRMLTANDQALLDGAGSVSRETMKTIATERFDAFDAQRRQYRRQNTRSFLPSRQACRRPSFSLSFLNEKHRIAPFRQSRSGELWRFSEMGQGLR